MLKFHSVLRLIWFLWTRDLLLTSFLSTPWTASMITCLCILYSSSVTTVHAAEGVKIKYQGQENCCVTCFLATFEPSHWFCLRRLGRKDTSLTLQASSPQARHSKAKGASSVPAQDRRQPNLPAFLPCALGRWAGLVSQHLCISSISRASPAIPAARRRISSSDGRSPSGMRRRTMPESASAAERRAH